MSSRSSTERQDSLPDTVVVARIRRPHGVRGEVAVDVLTDLPERLAAGSELILKDSAGGARPVRIVAGRPHGSGALVTIEGVESRDAAELLRGGLLEVERSRVPEAPDGSYYSFELVGCRCEDRVAGELGEVMDLVEDGGGILLEVVSGNREIMIPFVESFIERIDIAGRRIVLRLPDGLIEQCVFER